MAAAPPRPVVLCVLDGWGWREETADNAIAQARTPVWDRLIADSPHSRLEASAGAVGLPEGQMGNSEVGHMNIGAGRVVVQDLRRIDEAVRSGSILKNPALMRLIENLKKTGGVCHLMGLVSPGGVHSHQDQMALLARVVEKAGVAVAVHAFLDGRDTPPQSAKGYVERFARAVKGCAGLRFATVSGRYYAMDRDERWERIELAYRALVLGEGRRAADAAAAIAASYSEGVTDEFVAPTVLKGYAGMKDGDGILMANFRSDRVRQILTALLDPAFDGFERQLRVAFSAAVGMTEYSRALKPFIEALLPPVPLTNILGEVVARAGRRQLRVAETEKYAHVTFFFNGGREKPFEGEARILVPSPKVATYDEKPEMSAFEVTEKLIEAIDSGRFDFVVVNYANTDMVGHTGKLAAAIAAVEAVDSCLGRLARAVAVAGGALFITADHGNAECMRDPKTGAPHTAHSLSKVPALLVNPPPGVAALAEGRLADIAPTLLALLGLPVPAEMSGRSLLRRAEERTDADLDRLASI
jgi:2,3-bisphosphoglycerate-independent phosphoglycerate mutase